MEELTPVGLSQDGNRLVLVDDHGTEYSVAADRSLRRLLQGDRARLGQLEMKMESTLRPRDIQARIRAGESAEEVAAAAQTTVERIMGFAGPVLAERAHVAQSAQASSVRRKSADATSARTLGEAAATRLHELGLHDDDVTWDAWRRDDGRWTLVADYHEQDAPCRAEFTYDVRGRYVVADNDYARLLTGEARPAPAASPRAGSRRLAAVPDQDELPLGDDALELVSDHDVAVADPVSDPATADPATADPATADPVGTAEAERAADLRVPDPGPADEPADTGTDASEPSPGAGGPGAGDSDTGSDTGSHTGSRTGSGTGSEDRAEETTEETTEMPVRRRRRGRASVPSWDEIMFGGGGKPE